MDNAQSARKVVPAGPSIPRERSSSSVAAARERAPGRPEKAFKNVEQITHSGPQDVRRQQEVVYVTERAVFRLTRDGVALTEDASGVDVHRDVLERMEVKPVVPAAPALMRPACFDP